MKLQMKINTRAQVIEEVEFRVTRLLSDFKDRHLIAIQGSTLMIPNRAALESFANG
jgi:hypothetical protein